MDQPVLIPVKFRIEKKQINQHNHTFLDNIRAFFRPDFCPWFCVAVRVACAHLGPLLQMAVFLAADRLKHDNEGYFI